MLLCVSCRPSGKSGGFLRLSDRFLEVFILSGRGVDPAGIQHIADIDRVTSHVFIIGCLRLVLIIIPLK